MYTTAAKTPSSSSHSTHVFGKPSLSNHTATSWNQGNGMMHGKAHTGESNTDSAAPSAHCTSVHAHHDRQPGVCCKVPHCLTACPKSCGLAQHSALSSFTGVTATDSRGLTYKTCSKSRSSGDLFCSVIQCIDCSTASRPLMACLHSYNCSYSYSCGAMTNTHCNASAAVAEAATLPQC